MAKIDVTLKKLLSGGAPEFQAQIGLPRELNFLPSEVHEANELRVDLLGVARGTDTPFFHAEMQSTNHGAMLIRMVRYRAGISHRLLEEARYQPTEMSPLPDLRQVCLFVGSGEVRMPSTAHVDGNTLAFRLVDVRTLDVGRQLSSRFINDVVLAVLCRGGAIQRHLDTIMERVADLSMPARNEAYARLLILTSLRNVRDYVIERRAQMGFSIDLSEVPMIRDSYEAERAIGARAGRTDVLVRLLQNKFGEESVPEGIEESLADLNADAVIRMVEKVARATSVQAVLGDHMPLDARTYG